MSVELGDENSDEVSSDAEVSCHSACDAEAATKGDASQDPGDRAAKSVGTSAPAAAAKGSASCTVSAGSCGAHSSAAADRDDSDVEADGTATVDCAGSCTGETATSGTASGVRDGATRTSTGTSGCEVRGGECGAQSESAAGSTVDATDTFLTGTTVTDGDGFASSSTAADVDCQAGCAGSARTATSGEVTAGGTKPAVRTTGASSSCDATAGDCTTGAASHVGDSPREQGELATTVGHELATTAGHVLAAASEAGADVACELVGCAGSGTASTKGSASGDITGVRDSVATGSCTVSGAGGGCAVDSVSDVTDREPSDTPGAVTGPVATSDATMSGSCAGGEGKCSVSGAASSSARDTAVSPDRRGTTATTTCTVEGGACGGTTSSAASSAPDYAAVDPKTGLPAAGPSSTAGSSAQLDCPQGCTGTAASSATGMDGKLKRSSTGSVSCTTTGGACSAQTTSVASTSPGSAQQLSAGTTVNTARQVAGPSAASASGAMLTCNGQTVCDGKVTSAASATDPSVSPDPRGSRSEGSCTGVTGGVCQAVTNSGSSSEPNASIITPIMTAASTSNATVRHDDGRAGRGRDRRPDRSSRRRRPPVAPGSSASSGAPTVPGASSWSMASATLDCAGGTGVLRQRGQLRVGQRRAGHAERVGRGPRPTGRYRQHHRQLHAPAESGCQAQTSSTAGSGQVVADVIAEQQNTAAEQAAAYAEQAQQVADEAARIAAESGAAAEERSTQPTRRRPRRMRGRLRPTPPRWLRSR